MAEYIEREAAKRAIMSQYLSKANKTKYADVIDAVPAADVVTVRHGRWQITDAWPHNVYCSECHTKFAQTHWAVWEDGSLPRNYCPNCGAKQEVEE